MVLPTVGAVQASGSFSRFVRRYDDPVSPGRLFSSLVRKFFIRFFIVTDYLPEGS